MVGTMGRGGGAVFPGPGSQGRGLRGPMLFLTLFQPAPYSPPHCPFQVGAPAPPPCPPPCSRGTQMLRQKTQGIMTNQPSIILEAPKGIALVSPFYRKGEINPRRA